MAKRIEWKESPAYDEDGLIILQQDKNKLWNVFHKQTERKIMGPGIGPWKQKRDALAYAQALIRNFNLSFETEEQMYEKNGGKEETFELRLKSFYESKQV